MPAYDIARLHYDAEKIAIQTLEKVPIQPTLLRVPRTLMHMLLGMFAEETILSTVRAVPSKLISGEFQFQSGAIEQGSASCLRPKS